MLGKDRYEIRSDLALQTISMFKAFSDQGKCMVGKRIGRATVLGKGLEELAGGPRQSSFTGLNIIHDRGDGRREILDGDTALGKTRQRLLGFSPHKWIRMAEVLQQWGERNG